MEFVDEGNLTNLINCYPAIVFSEGENLLVISQVLEGLLFLHNQGFIHRLIIHSLIYSPTLSLSLSRSRSLALPIFC